jgi:hypothetical protein
MDAPLLYASLANWNDGSPSRVVSPVEKGAPKIQRRALEDVTLETLATLYTRFPVGAAAKHIGVGLTAFKQRCRQLGVARWPHRQVSVLLSNARSYVAERMSFLGAQLRSLEQLIEQVTAAHSDGAAVSDCRALRGCRFVFTSRVVQDLVDLLRKEHERLLLDPNIRLPTWVKRARQAHYKVRSDVTRSDLACV